MLIGTMDDIDGVQSLMDELRKPEVACLTNASVEDEKLLMSLLCGPSPDSSAAKSKESSRVYCSEKSTSRRDLAKKPMTSLLNQRTFTRLKRGEFEGVFKGLLLRKKHTQERPCQKTDGITDKLGVPAFGRGQTIFYLRGSNYLIRFESF